MELPEALSGPRLGRAASLAAWWALALGGVALVASLAALVVVSLRKQQQQQPAAAPPPGQQNYAQLVLRLETSLITSRDLDWYNTTTTQGVALGPFFEYSNKALKVKFGGLYCVYAQMNITRSGRCSGEKAVDASLWIRRHTARSSSTVLILPLDLSRCSYETVPLFKAVPHRLEKDDRLQVTIEASEDAHKYGSLSSRNSFFGLFQIPDTVPQ